MTFLLLLLSLAIFSEASEKVNLTPESTKKAATPGTDPGSATPLVLKGSTQELAPKKGGPTVKFAGFCTDSKGMTYRSDEPGYEACLGAGGDKTRAPTEKTGMPGFGIMIGK